MYVQHITLSPSNDNTLGLLNNNIVDLLCPQDQSVP
uniref:Uncharacterized protein n=1 Tax=Arundo donax TaxID=35708 RepID=A0A0A9A745_ARUDO